MKIHQQNAYSVLNMIIHKESHSCECGFIQTSFCIEYIAYYHYSLILWYFVAKSNIFSFQIKLLATFDHMRDRKNAWE